MNISTYIFGRFPSGYNQFPDDFTNDIFDVFYDNSHATTQLTVHRKDDLMYYGYIRKIEQDCYIGLCAVLNGIFLKHPERLFAGFEHIIELMVKHGRLLNYTNDGNITTTVNKLYENEEERQLINNAIFALFNGQESQVLPATTYSISKSSVKSFSIFDDATELERSTYTNGYTIIYKSKNYDTSEMLSYKNILSKQNDRMITLKDDNKKLKKELSEWKKKQKNTKLVSTLAVITFILGVVIWNKVLYPSEVTKYDAGEFLYYGPMQNGKPNGTGVAIYHNKDKDHRLYYYGNFQDGKRKDTNAIMFYKDGSYFKGSMVNDKWLNGLFFDVNKALFIGEFNNNEPFSGTWYELQAVQNINQGN